MKTYNSSMFESIKTALNKDEKANTRKDILKFAPGNTYTVRLIPNVDDPSKTFFHYFQMGWKSFATGQYISYTSPTTVGERDPVAEERYKIVRNGTDEEKEKAKAIIRSEKWLCNAYIVEDPVNPENRGTVKVLRYGKQLHKIIDSAINGDDATEFGSRVFDLSKEGVNLKIKCEQQGDFPTFVSSRFTSASDLKLNAEKQSEVYSNIHDLEAMVSIKGIDELKTLFKEHYLGGTEDEAPKKDVKKASKPTPAEDQDADEPTNSKDAEIEDMLKDLA